VQKIELTQDKFALVDDDIYEILQHFPWHYKAGHKYTGYACTSLGKHGPKHYMHRIIMQEQLQFAPELFVDHIDHNGLNNQRSNLRLVTVSQNNLNARGYCNNTSGQKGVYFDKHHNRWKVCYRSQGRGYFSTFDEAVAHRKDIELTEGSFLMAFPIGAALMAGSTLLGGIMGNSAQKKQLKAQEQQAANELAIQKEQLALQKELQRRGIATQVDANGNVTSYDEASNSWKTVLSPTQQRLQTLSDAEQIAQLTTDAPMSRLESIVNATRRSKEGTTADGIRASLSDSLVNPVRGSDLASSLRLSREKAVNQGFDDVSRSIGTQALRSGASGGSALAASLAKQRAQAIAQTIGNPDIEGMQAAAEMNSNKRSELGNLYNVMASRASGAPVGSFSPTGTAVNASSALAAARGLAGQSSGQAGNLLAQAGQTTRTTPDYVGNSSAPLMASISSLLGSGALDKFLPAAKRTSGFTWDESMGA
jgi:hypothetical protein